ncbi:MAG: hypothetical protein WB679_20530 [Terracidiphilus sp.]
MTRFENLPTPSNSSPFLKAFLKTDRVWDRAAKREWADDVERRLREVTADIDPGPRVFGYAIQRVKNCVAIYTVTPNGQSKREIAALTRGQWPCWDRIVKVVPELMHSTISFDARTTWEWARKWDVEIELSRLRLEEGIFE